MAAGRNSQSKLPAESEKEVMEKRAGSSLRQSAASSSFWAMSGFGITQGVRLLSNIVFAALLFEEAFALMAIVLAVSQGLLMFSDIGLRTNIIQSRQGDSEAFLNTAWTIQIARGLILGSMLLAVAHPLTAFYSASDPSAESLKGLLAILALATIIQDFQSTKIHTASRHLTIGRVTILTVSSQLAGIAFSILLAWLTRSVYSLAWGILLSAVLLTTMSHILLPGKSNRITWDRSSAREIIHFGKWILLSTALTFLAMQLDKLVFSRLFPLALAGVYTISANLAYLAPLLNGNLLNAVAFPLYSRMLENQDSLEEPVRKSKLILLSVAGLITAGLASCGSTFIHLAYDSRYEMAAVYLPILAAGYWFVVVENIYSAALLSKGRANWIAAINATKVIMFCLLIIPAMKVGGILGAVVATSLADASRLVVAIFGARIIGLRNRGPELLYTAYWIIVAGAAHLVGQYLGNSLGIHLAWVLLLQVMMVTLLFLPALFYALRIVRRSLHGESSGKGH